MRYRQAKKVLRDDSYRLTRKRKTIISAFMVAGLMANRFVRYMNGGEYKTNESRWYRWRRKWRGINS